MLVELVMYYAFLNVVYVAFCLPFSCVLVEDWYYLVHCDVGLVYYKKQLLLVCTWVTQKLYLD
jgi:hypothetical protein